MRIIPSDQLQEQFFSGANLTIVNNKGNADINTQGSLFQIKMNIPIKQKIFEEQWFKNLY